MKLRYLFKRKQRRSSNLSGLLLAAPALILVLAFQLVPVLYTLRLSVAEPTGFKLKGYVGFENFVKLFSDNKFLNLEDFPASFPTGALVVSLKWIIVAVPAVIIIGMIVALVADNVNLSFVDKRNRRLQALVRSTFFLPMVISGTVIGIIWMFMYAPSPKIGFLNAVLHGSYSWLGDPELVIPSQIAAWVWSQCGMSVIILSAALKGVSQDLLDAGKVDGTTSWQRFWHITVPSIRQPISFLLVTQLVQVLKVFDVVYVTTEGGPAGMSRTMALLFFEQTFRFMKPQYGAAIVTIMSLIIVTVFSITRKIGEEK